MKIASLQASASNSLARPTSSGLTQSRATKSLATAAVALAASVPLMTAQAAVVYIAPNAQVTTSYNDGNSFVQGTSVNVTLSTESFDFTASLGKDSGVELSNLPQDFSLTNTIYSGAVYAVALNSTIDGNASLSSDSDVFVVYGGNLADTGYFGFAFDPTGSGTPDYGWGSFLFGPDGHTATLTGLAYEDTGAAITVGDTGPAVTVPEPATPLTMAAGFGLAGWIRRRRRSTKA